MSEVKLSREADAQLTRQERERREAEAREKHNGWGAEFGAWIPMAIIVTVLVAAMMFGMYAIEMASI